MKNRIEREKATVQKMIALYCYHHLKLSHIPPEYIQLGEYACQRLTRCKFGNEKPSCKKCKIHCYAPEKRKQIREIMRWAGPRMILHAPLQTIKHLFS